MTAQVSSAAGPDELFERERPRLLGLAYRMLGTMADAEDVVQEAWLRWRSAAPERPEAWLTTVTTRLALDRLRLVRRRREQYVGPWLPEPLVTAPGPEDSAELADTLTLGFLTLLDHLGPVERVVFLLADVFAVPFAEIAEMLGRSEAACRQVASRGRRRLRAGLDGGPQGRAVAVTNDGDRRAHRHDRKVVDELVLAVATGDIAGALARLAPDVVMVSDGGPHRRAARRPVVGADRVVRLLSNLAKRVSGPAEFAAATVNRDPGLVISIAGRPDIVFAFHVEEGVVASIWAVRNPEKLERVHQHPQLL